MPFFSTWNAVLTLALLLILARPAHAFGAGNIASVAKIEGINCEVFPELEIEQLLTPSRAPWRHRRYTPYTCYVASRWWEEV